MHSSTELMALREQCYRSLEERIATCTDEEARRTPQATDKLKRELDRLDTVLTHLTAEARQRIVYVMIQEMEILAYQISLAAADIITEPMRQEARATRDTRILDEAFALFKSLVG